MPEKEDALTKTYDLILWLFPQVAKFPRNYRFILGDRIQNLMLDITAQLIEARYTQNKLHILSHINISLEQLRYLNRLSKDLHLINDKKYEYMAKEINAIGIYVGGWIKSLRRQNT